MEVRKIPPEELIPQYQALLAQGHTDLPLIITGNSMHPFLINERDAVFLSPVQFPLRRGELLLYRRDNGQYVLHRVCKVSPDGCDTVGDGQYRVERGIRPDQMIATVHRVMRKGKLLQKGSFLWWVFEKPWLWLLPLRPKLLPLFNR